MRSGKTAQITQARLRELLNYNPETGVFTNRVTRGRAGKGSIAGTTPKKGYRKIKIDGRTYSASRLAWLYMKGELLKEIDHKSLVRDDDRFDNLRPATRRQQAHNRRCRSDSGTGLKGAQLRSDGRGYYSTIMVDGRPNYLGLFKTPEEAHSAYCAAAERYFGAYARRA